MTEVLPTKAIPKRIFYLSHYAEYHYGSLKKIPYPGEEEDDLLPSIDEPAL